MREIIVDEGNTAYHVNTDKNKKLNISVLPQPETNEPWNELMADRESLLIITMRTFQWIIKQYMK